MLYDISLNTANTAPAWGEGVGSISARLANGKEAKIPVLEAVNVLTVGVTGTGKSKS